MPGDRNPAVERVPLPINTYINAGVFGKKRKARALTHQQFADYMRDRLGCLDLRQVSHSLESMLGDVTCKPIGVCNRQNAIG